MSESSIQFRPYENGDKAILMKILEDVYDAALRRRYEFLWDWWQKRSAFTNDDNHRPVVVLRAGKIAGFMGLQPRRFKIGAMEEEGVFIMDSFTHPSERGIGISLCRQIYKTNELTLGAPTPRTHDLWQKISKQEKIDVYFVKKGKRVIDASLFLPASLKTLFAWPTRWLWRTAEFFIELFCPRLSSSHLEAVTRFPDAVNGLCNRWATLQKNTALRDADYLNWRFADSPVKYEKRLLWQGDVLVGLAAFRVAIMNGRRMLLLVEIIAHHTDLTSAYGSLLLHILQYARLAKVSDFQTFDCGCPALNRALRKSGFIFRMEKSPLIGLYRHDFSVANPFYRSQDWFISAGDGDFEFTYFKQGLESLEANFASP